MKAAHAAQVVRLFTFCNQDPIGTKKMKTILATLMAIALVGCCSSDEGLFGASGQDRDALGYECGQPVYTAPHCPGDGLKNWIEGVHEDIFDCEPDPEVQAAPAPDCE